MGRLFWKIFLWFCLTLVLISLSVGWAVKIYVEISASEHRKEVPLTQVTALALALEQGGRAQARDLLRHLRRETRHPIFVLDADGQDILQQHLPHRLEHLLTHWQRHPDRFLSKTTSTPDGEQLVVIGPAFDNWAPRQPGPLRTPLWLVVSVALLIGVVLCFGLARYLSEPVARLSRASHALAEGDLNTRIGSQGRRRDEIADLAVDFDRMAERIDVLVRSQKQLLSDISHELRSPLARLQVAVALGRREVSPGTSAITLDRIERDVQRMETLIGQLLTLSRLDANREIPLDEIIDLESLLRELMNDCYLEASARNCQFRLRIESQVPITGNLELLRRAFENVMRNAILHTADNTDIEITVKSARDRVTTTICDHGPGVPEADLDRLFDPFVRMDSARDRRTGGHGLGLAIARRALEVHRGTITAENRSDGKGLCLHLILPTQAS